MTVGIICNTQTVAYDISSPGSCITIVSTSGQPSMPVHGYFEIAFAQGYQAALFSNELAAHLGVSDLGSLEVACAQGVQGGLLVNYAELPDVELCGANECRVQVDFKCRVERSALDAATITARLIRTAPVVSPLTHTQWLLLKKTARSSSARCSARAACKIHSSKLVLTL